MFDLLCDDVHIIGCGRIGSNLAVSLIENNFPIRVLHLYDPDRIIKCDSKNILFSDEDMCLGKYKVEYIRDYIDSNFDSHPIIHIHRILVDEKVKGSFVFDCRDRKDKKLSSNLKISLDDSILILDSLQNKFVEDYHSYSLTEVQYVKQAMSFIIDYLKKEQYLIKRKILIDLNFNEEVILLEENS